MLLQFALVGLYFGSGYLLRHVQTPAASPAPAANGGTVIQHMLAELEAQGTSFIRGIMAQAVQNAMQTPPPPTK
jgi:hypothetical protein